VVKQHPIYLCYCAEAGIWISGRIEVAASIVRIPGHGSAWLAAWAPGAGGTLRTGVLTLCVFLLL